MSKKTVGWRRRLRKAGGTAAAAEAIIPNRIAQGAGTYLSDTPTASSKGPHGTRNAGTVCSRPMGDAKAARLRALVKK